MVKVLIVDDNKDVTYSLGKSLESLNEGYEISTAHSGKECLEKVHQHKPDIVLLDIMMPEMDGWEVANKITDIPVLFITGKANMMREAKSRRIEFLMKPIDIKELDARIKQLMKLWSS